MPFFSIVIPLYNKEKYIEKTLKSVLNQSFTDFEILIVNDGSTDGCVEKILRFKDERLKIFHQENKGVSVARNKGIKESQAEYICFLDADDEWMSDYLQNLHETILKFPDAGIYCSRYFTKINEKKLCKNPIENISDDYEGYVSDFFASSLRYRIALTSAVCVHKNVFYEIGGFDEKISSGQDLDYWIRIAQKYPVVITNKETMIYNFQLPDSLSKTNINKKTLPDFSKFSEEEQENPSLKKFLDLYRTEYALHFHIVGNEAQKDEFLKNVNQNTLPLKTKILFSLPSFILRKLLFTKRYLKRLGIDFSVYH